MTLEPVHMGDIVQLPAPRCALAELLSHVRDRVDADLAWIHNFSAATNSKDGRVTNATSEVVARHVTMLRQSLLAWEEGGLHGTNASELVNLVARVAVRLKLFADNVGQVSLLNVLPHINTHHKGFQAIIAALSSAGWPRFIYSDIYGARWRVLAALLRGLVADGRPRARTGAGERFGVHLHGPHAANLSSLDITMLLGAWVRIGRSLMFMRSTASFGKPSHGLFVKAKRGTAAFAWSRLVWRKAKLYSTWPHGSLCHWQSTLA